MGWNCRMDGIQAGILRVKLRHLPAWNEARRQHAALYDQHLSDIVRTPFEAPYATHVYHQYCIRLPNRNDLLGRMANKGISCGIHYPFPIYSQGVYASSQQEITSCRNAEHYAEECLSLPMFPEMTRSQQDYTIEVLQSHVVSHVTMYDH